MNSIAASVLIQAHQYRHDDRELLPKVLVATLFCAMTLYLARFFGPYATFFTLDTILSLFLVSLFHGRLRFLFLLHPFFVFISSFGFDMPYNDIGTSWTYHQTFERFIDPDTLMLDWRLLVQAMFFSTGNFGFQKIYVGIIPILFLPRFLFGDVPDIINYFSLSMFTMLYAAIGVTVARALGSMRGKLLLVIALYATVSPTFLEINKVMHRYGLMFLGLFLVLNAYMGFLQKRGFSSRKPILLLVMLIGLTLVVVSRPPMCLAVLLFIVLERFTSNKLPLVSHLFKRSNRNLKIILVLLGIVLFQCLGKFVIPEQYATHFSQVGGRYRMLSNLPIIGLVLRVVYAALSPFPFFGFSQWELYGNNELFLVLHLFSAIFAIWLVISVFSRLRSIVNDDGEVRVVVMFGLSIMASLAFSAVGHQSYIAPALPFLAVVLLRRSTRIPIQPAAGFVLFMEIVAQMARLAR